MFKTLFKIIFIIAIPYQLLSFDLESDTDITLVTLAKQHNNSKPLVLGNIGFNIKHSSLRAYIGASFNNSYKLMTPSNNQDILFNAFMKYNYNNLHKIYVGMINSAGSYGMSSNNLVEKPYFGYNIFNRYTTSILKNPTIIMPSPFLENNKALSIAYIFSPLYEQLNMGISYTPNDNNFIANNKNKPNSKEVEKYTLGNEYIDLNISYENEWNTLGYLVRISNRQYINLSSKMETSYGLSLKYFGFLLEANYLRTNLDKNNIVPKYNSTDIALYYSFTSLTTGFYYLESDINFLYNKYNTQLLEYNVIYQTSQHLSIKTAIYKEYYANKFIADSEKVSSLGFAIGLNIKV